MQRVFLNSQIKKKLGVEVGKILFYKGEKLNEYYSISWCK